MTESEYREISARLVHHTIHMPNTEAHDAIGRTVTRLKLHRLGQHIKQDIWGLRLRTLGELGQYNPLAVPYSGDGCA